MECITLEKWLETHRLEITIERKIPSELSMPWRAFIPGLRFVHGCVIMGAVEYGNTPDDALNRLKSLFTPHKEVIIRQQHLLLPVINIFYKL